MHLIPFSRAEVGLVLERIFSYEKLMLEFSFHGSHY